MKKENSPIIFAWTFIFGLLIFVPLPAQSKTAWWKNFNPATPVKTSPKRHTKRETLFKRFENKTAACPSGNPKLCVHPGFSNEDVKLPKKVMTFQNNDMPNATNTVCLGLCDKQAGFAWSLNWK